MCTILKDVPCGHGGGGEAVDEDGFEFTLRKVDYA